MEKRVKLAVLIVLLGFSVVSFGLFVPSAYSWTPLEGRITQDTTLMLANSPYRVINDVTVDAGVKLTIEPRVTIEFADGFSLIVNGSLDATGTDANPIVFTSSRVSPNAGAWNTIKFQGGITERFLLQHSKIEYATNGVSIQSLGSSIAKRNSISNCSESGVMVLGPSNTAIRENIIEDNQNGISAGPLDYVAYSGITITNNTIVSNQRDGIRLGNGQVQVSNVSVAYNTVSSNGGNGIGVINEDYMASIVDFSFSCNIVSLNGGNGIHLYSAGYPGSWISNITFSSNTVTYNEQNGIYVGMNRGSISEVLFWSNNASYNVLDGIYIIAPHQVSNVSFSSNTVSSNGGNGIHLHAYTDYYHMGDGRVSDVSFSSDTVSSNGRNGIYLHSVGYMGNGDISDVSFASCVVSFNGENGIYLQTNGLYYIKIFNISISFGIVSHNSGKGIYLQSGMYSDALSNIYNIAIWSNTISSNEDGVYAEAREYESGIVYGMTLSANMLSGNRDKGIWMVGAVNANMTSNSISYSRFGVFLDGSQNNHAASNDIYANDYGMNVTNGAMATAEYNYWGDSTGPYQSSLNPEGKGNPVNGNGVDLDFIPWLSAPNGHVNERPIAKLTADKTSISKGQTVTFDASSSTDDGRVDRHFFNFGDNKNSNWTTLSVVKHNYTSTGVYTANLTVMDDFGAVSNNIATQTITVAQQLPTLVVSLVMDPLAVNSEKNISVHVRVTDGTVGVKDASINLVSDKGGTFTAQSAYTNSSGDFTSVFTAPGASTQTNVRITATASKSGYSDGSDYEYVTVFPSGQALPSLSIALSADPTILQPYEMSLITIQVTYGGNPTADAIITLTSDKGTEIMDTTGYTDSDGYFTTSCTAPEVTTQTTITITVTATKTGYLNGQGQTQITVNPAQSQSNQQQPDMTMWIYFGIAAIFLVSMGSAVTIYKRKSRKPKTEWTTGTFSHYAFSGSCIFLSAF